MVFLPANVAPIAELPSIHDSACPIEITSPTWIPLLVEAIPIGAPFPVDPDTGRSLLDVLITTRMNVPHGGLLSARVRCFAAYLAHQGQPITHQNATRLHRLRARPGAPVVFAPVLDALVDQALLRAGSLAGAFGGAAAPSVDAEPSPTVPGANGAPGGAELRSPHGRKL
jgi:hypothetical protein